MKILHLLHKYFLLLILLFVLIQCETEEESLNEESLNSVPASINLKDSTYRVGSSKGILKISVLSSRPDWEASTEIKKAWITSIEKNQSNDSLIVQYTERTKRSSRSVHIVLSSGSVRKKITCTQNGLRLLLSKRDLTVTPTKGQAKIGIKASDVNWIASTAEETPWISSLEKNLSSDTLIINYNAQAEKGILRNATINLELSTLNKSFSLTQQSLVILEIDPDPGASISLPAEGGEQRMRIQILAPESENRNWNYTSNPRLNSNTSLYSIIRYPDGLSIHAAPNTGSPRSLSITLSFTGGTVPINGKPESSLSLNLTQASYSKDPRPPNMPQGLYTHLNGDRILLLSPKILIARKGRHTNQETKERVRQLISGYNRDSVNPLLLRLGAYIDPQSDIYYVDLPDDFHTNPRPEYNVVDASGQPIKTANNKHDSTVYLGNGFFQILILNDLAGIGFPPNVLGAAEFPGRKIWLEAGISSVVLGHELGHSLGLEHTNTPEACERDNAFDFLMNSGSGYLTMQRARVKPCENEIATSTGRLYQSHGIVKKWTELGLSTAQDVLAGWRIISQNTSSLLDGNSAARGLPQPIGTNFCGWHPGLQSNEAK